MYLLIKDSLPAWIINAAPKVGTSAQKPGNILS